MSQTLDDEQPQSETLTQTKATTNLGDLGQMQLKVKECRRCGYRRDFRIDFCENCGADNTDSDETHVIVPSTTDIYYDSETPRGSWPLGDEDGVNRIAAHKQSIALLEGNSISAEEALRDAELAVALETARRPTLNERVQEVWETGPMSTRGWEANPFGLSGRLIRGYKHWRHKR